MLGKRKIGGFADCEDGKRLGGKNDERTPRYENKDRKDRKSKKLRQEEDLNLQRKKNQVVPKEKYADTRDPKKRLAAALQK